MKFNRRIRFKSKNYFPRTFQRQAILNSFTEQNGLRREEVKYGRQLTKHERSVIIEFVRTFLDDIATGNLQRS